MIPLALLVGTVAEEEWKFAVLADIHDLTELAYVSEADAPMRCCSKIYPQCRRHRSNTTAVITRLEKQQRYLLRIN